MLDIAPHEWAPAALEPFKDVCDDPVAWAQKCVEEYGADFICLWLFGTDPNGSDLSPDHAAEVSKYVADAIDVPLIVWGVSSDDKNRDTLRAVCESCEGMNLAVGPITENTYKQIGAAAIAYKHVVVANSPIDINLAKQLNILLETLGMPDDRIIMDPTTSGVGYGMEYCYSIMERIRQAALCQNDEKLQYPILNNIAEEVWKVKEAKLPEEEDPKLGAASTRGINLEAVTAVSVLNAGSDMLILRHPETLRRVRDYVSQMMALADLESMEVDLDLTVTEPKAAPAAKPAAPPKAAAAPKAAPKPKAPPKPAGEAPEKEKEEKATPPEKPAPKPKAPPKPKPAAAAEAPREEKAPIAAEARPIEEAPAQAEAPPPEEVPAAAAARAVEEVPVVAETPSGEEASSPVVEKTVHNLVAEPEAEDLEEDEFAAAIRRMDLPDDERRHLGAALYVWRAIRTLESKVEEAQRAGAALEDLDFAPDEITAYRDVQSLGGALSVLEAKVDESEISGVAVDELDYSEAELTSLRAGFAVLSDKGLARPTEDAFIAKLQEMEFSEVDLNRFRTALSVWKTIQALEGKISNAAQIGVPLEDLEFFSRQIASYREIRSLGAALRIIESKIEEAEARGREGYELDFSEAEIEALRSGLAALKTRGAPLVPPADAAQAELTAAEPTVSAPTEALMEEAVEETEYEYALEIDLPDEDVETLRQMLSIFRAAKRVVVGIKNLMKREAA